MATKDKRKAAITAIKYSALDRAILFSFYNHPQPPPTTLGMGWWDKYQSWKVEPTRGRWEGSESYYKRKNKQSRKGAGKKGEEPEPPRLYRGDRLFERTWFSSVSIPRLTTVRWPRPSFSNPRSTNYIVCAFLRANPILFWGRYKSSPYNWRRLWERLVCWHRRWVEKVPPSLPTARCSSLT